MTTFLSSKRTEGHFQVTMVCRAFVDKHRYRGRRLRDPVQFLFIPCSLFLFELPLSYTRCRRPLPKQTFQIPLHLHRVQGTTAKARLVQELDTFLLEEQRTLYPQLNTELKIQISDLCWREGRLGEFVLPEHPLIKAKKQKQKKFGKFYFLIS